MEILIFLVISLITIFVFFKWIIIFSVTIIVMGSGGFFAGLGAGLFTYLLLKLAKWVTLGYLAAKAAALTSEQPEPKEAPCSVDKKKP